MPTKMHVVLSGSKRAKDPDATRVGDVDPKEKFAVTVGLTGPKLPGPGEYVGETLTPQEFAEKFGARQDDADKVAKSLKKFGLKVDSVSLATRSMSVSGTAAAMEAAFKPGLAMMRSPDQGEYRGRQGTLQIPAELKGIVTGVFGLDERQMARRKSLSAGPAHAAGTLSPLTPADLEQRATTSRLAMAQARALRSPSSAAAILRTTRLLIAKSSGDPCPTLKRWQLMRQPILWNRFLRFLPNSATTSWALVSR
jgi:hypothetical protein